MGAGKRRRIKQRMCGRKKKHRTEQEAEAARDKMPRACESIGECILVYKCRFCFHWHVGHSVTRSKQDSSKGDS